MNAGLPTQLNELTSLRFFAAFAVVHVHLPKGTLPESIEQPVLNTGYLGVDLFFILSGFVLAHAYPYRENRPLDYGSFLRNRFARVMPLHLFMCGLFVLVLTINQMAGHPPSDFADWSTLPAHLLAIHSLGTVNVHAWNFPSWSISAEMFAYTLFPLFMHIARSVPAWLYFFAASMVLASTYLVLAAFGYPMTRMTIEFGVVRAVLGFAVGVALQHVILRIPNPGSIAPIGFYLTSGIIIVGLAWQIDDLWILLLLAPLIGFGAGLATSETPTILRHRWLVWLGERSFAIYMVHVFVILMSPAILDPLALSGSRLAVYVVNMGIIILFAHLLYRLVECPARQWLRATARTAAKPSTMQNP